MATLNAVTGILLTLPLVLGFSEEIQELIDMLHNTCIEETGTSEELIKNARSGEFSDDENFKCYFKCIMAQMACIDDDGIIDVEATIAVLPEEYQEKGASIIRTCDTQVGSNPCDNAWLTNKCYYKQNPEAYFLV